MIKAGSLEAFKSHKDRFAEMRSSDEVAGERTSLIKPVENLTGRVRTPSPPTSFNSSDFCFVIEPLHDPKLMLGKTSTSNVNASGHIRLSPVSLATSQSTAVSESVTVSTLNLLRTNVPCDFRPVAKLYRLGKSSLIFGGYLFLRTCTWRIRHDRYKLLRQGNLYAVKLSIPR